MSPLQFQSTALCISDWLAYLRTLELETRHLSIEITEGLLLNANDDVKDKLLQFRDAGVEVAIDDFGVGYSAYHICGDSILTASRLISLLSEI